jgi:hypothetical protein
MTDALKGIDVGKQDNDLCCGKINGDISQQKGLWLLTRVFVVLPNLMLELLLF